MRNKIIQFLNWMIVQLSEKEPNLSDEQIEEIEKADSILRTTTGDSAVG